MILHGIEYQRPTSLNMRILADHVTYSFLAFMKSIFHFCLGCYCGGYSQNGRSNLSSSFYYRYVEGADLFLCGTYTFNHYKDCKDTHYFLCGDKINDVICLPTDKVPELMPILACNDRTLRVIAVSSNSSDARGGIFQLIWSIPCLLVPWLARASADMVLTV